MKRTDIETNALTDVPTATIRVKSANISVTNGPDAGRSARIDRPSFLIGTGPPPISA